MTGRGRGGGGRGGGDGNADKIVSRYMHCATCQRSHFLPGRGTLSAHEARCAVCQFQVLTVKNEETNKEHTVCPSCFKLVFTITIQYYLLATYIYIFLSFNILLYRSPPGPPVSEEGVSELRCMSCAHPTCALAGRLLGADVDIAPCYDWHCAGQMRLKKTRAGFMLSCVQNACKSVWWVPKSVRSGKNLYRQVLNTSSSSCQ